MIESEPKNSRSINLKLTRVKDPELMAIADTLPEHGGLNRWFKLVGIQAARDANLSRLADQLDRIERRLTHIEQVCTAGGIVHIEPQVAYPASPAEGLVDVGQVDFSEEIG
jgi:hypothetical protein